MNIFDMNGVQRKAEPDLRKDVLALGEEVAAEEKPTAACGDDPVAYGPPADVAGEISTIDDCALPNWRPT